ncbi:MAG TPA: hypothetical protein PLA41_00700 [Candidatus Pacearchaeota archaeon]|nr:hypothetical protein [Candidatus Parcubacteria bacterium]HOU45656.1 hypothetical protein [Candidatus Pacearchaeota archaeon]HPM08282.1 hypothetical protein [Candidatus Pacearchaeota archaeon]HQI74585.1 hypothetical protein [Candidatus Pacearchaeota archaeon]
MKKNIFFFALAISCIFTCVAMAQTVPTKENESYGGLLKGIPRDPSKVSTCHFFVLLDNIIDFILFQLNIIVTVCLFVYIGVLYYFGGDDPAKVSLAQKTFESMMKGLFIMYGAWLFVSLFFNVIGISEWTGLKNGWFEIKCGK